MQDFRKISAHHLEAISLQSDGLSAQTSPWACKAFHVITDQSKSEESFTGVVFENCQSLNYLFDVKFPFSNKTTLFQRFSNTIFRKIDLKAGLA